MTAQTGLPPGTSLISAENIGFRRCGRQLLSHAAVEVRPGEIVTLIGPNGAGKTTLVRILLGLEEPNQGRVVRRPGIKIGYVPQRFSIDPSIPLSVARFMTLGVPAGPEKIRRLLREVGAEHLIDADMGHLSGGEFQRVLLGRALIDDPDVLVLDEPVQGVDYQGEADFYELIGRLRTERGCGILMVSHDLHVVFSGSDHVVCLNHHVCCSGVPEKVAKDPEYLKLFGPDHADAFGIYRHHHDHTHDLTGRVQPSGDPSGSETQNPADHDPACPHPHEH